MAAADHTSKKSPKTNRGTLLFTACILLGTAWLLATESPFIFGRSRRLLPPAPELSPVPLTMPDGDPYVRALMRTISAAEANTAEPYHTLYGGQRINNLTAHPDQCVDIVAGPNLGNCTTAAGRYQFITTTWLEKARAYHPEPPQWYSWWADYSFEAVYQDKVVYRWLSDTEAWGVDIPTLLREGRLDEVLYLLSGTWTSLGYGIEDNVVTPYLHQIYQDMLVEELQRSPQS